MENEKQPQKQQKDLEALHAKAQRSILGQCPPRLSTVGGDPMIPRHLARAHAGVAKLKRKRIVNNYFHYSICVSHGEGRGTMCHEIQLYNVVR